MHRIPSTEYLGIEGHEIGMPAPIHLMSIISQQDRRSVRDFQGSLLPKLELDPVLAGRSVVPAMTDRPNENKETTERAVCKANRHAIGQVSCWPYEITIDDPGPFQ